MCQGHLWALRGATHTPPPLTELIEVGVRPVGSWHGADEPSFQEGRPLVHQAALPSHVVLPGEGRYRCQQWQVASTGAPSPPAHGCPHPADLTDAGKAGLAQPLLPLHCRLAEEEVDLIVIGVLTFRHPKNGHELGLWGQRGATSSAPASSAPRGPSGTRWGPRRVQTPPCPAARQRQSEGRTSPGTGGLRGARGPPKSPSTGSGGRGAAEPEGLIAPMPPGSSDAAPGCRGPRRPHAPGH